MIIVTTSINIHSQKCQIFLCPFIHLVVKNLYKPKTYYGSRKHHDYIYEDIFCSVCACTIFYIFLCQFGGQAVRKKIACNAHHQPYYFSLCSLCPWTFSRPEWIKPRITWSDLLTYPDFSKTLDSRRPLRLALSQDSMIMPIINYVERDSLYVSINSS